MIKNFELQVLYKVLTTFLTEGPGNRFRENTAEIMSFLPQLSLLLGGEAVSMKSVCVKCKGMCE